MRIFYYIYKSTRRIVRLWISYYDRIATLLKFTGNKVNYSSFRTAGIPHVMVARGGQMNIGNNFAMNNGINHNPIGMPQPCTFLLIANAR